MIPTLYVVWDERGCQTTMSNRENADRLLRAGLSVGVVSS